MAYIEFNMPLTSLDPNAALVVIDLQKGIVALPAAQPPPEIVTRAAKLAQAFRQRGLPVVLVNVTAMAPGRIDSPRPKREFPPDWTELVPELDRQPSDHLVTKQRYGAFLGTDLDAFLRKQGVTQIFLAGISSSAGVESTARSAYDLGYHVVFVSDAITDPVLEAQQYCLTRVFPHLGEVDTTEAVLAKLETRA